MQIVSNVKDLVSRTAVAPLQVRVHALPIPLLHPLLTMSVSVTTLGGV